MNMLAVGKAPEEYSILKTDSVLHDINLEKDKFYSFTIDQRGMDVVVYLVNNKSEIVKEKDSPNGSNGPEQFYYYCENQGQFRLRIKPFDDDNNPEEGNYAITITEVSTDVVIDLDEQKMLADYQIFKGIFEKANSGLYRYYPKQKVDSVFAVNRNKINSNTTYLEFYNLVWNVIDYTGSCHNNLNFPESLKTLLFRKKIFFPIPLKYIDGKLYSNGNANSIPAGSEIISVNAIGAAEFSTRISQYRSTDGFNRTAKYKFIQTNWAPTYIYNVYGEKKEFTIKYKHDGVVKTMVAKSVDFPTYRISYNARYSRAYEERIRADFHYRYNDTIDTGLLTIKSFNFGEQGDESYVAYESFLDSVFISLKNKKNLIVDIRGNGGGSGDALMLLTSYLSKRNVKENTQAYTLFEKVPMPQYYKNDEAGTEEFLSEYLCEFKNGKYYQNQKFNPIWEPAKNAYQGVLFLLIDPFVASAASHFAAHIKSDKSAMVIGEETGGGYYGHTGHIPVDYELPNSKLAFNFSIVNVEQDVAELADEKLGDGVMPDIRIVQNHEDFLKNEDSQLNFVFECIKNEAQQ